MTDKPLTIPEKSALLVLMLMGKEVANSEIETDYKFVIKKEVRDGLVARQFIAAREETRPRRHYLHKLTEEGWKQGLGQLAEPIAGKADKSFRVLHGVLAALHTHLTRTGQDLQTFLHSKDDGDDQLATPVPATVTAPVDVTERIESAYDSLVARPGGWVSLARLRSALDALPRDAIDEALQQLSRRPQVYLIPEANQKILTPEDRAAAVNLGGEAKHLLSIERS